MELTRWSTAGLATLLTVLLAGSVVFGWLLGRRLHHRADVAREPVGVIQGALLGLVGLLLAFGLTMAVDRYDQRRSLVVEQANDIGTTALRARLLPEPQRSASVALIDRYAESAVELAEAVPGTDRFRSAAGELESLHPELWDLAAESVAADPTGTGPRLYVESLNTTIDVHTSRLASLTNRVPTEVMFVLLLGSAVALAVLSLYLTLLGRGLVTSVITALVVFLTLFVSFDLDRPQRGLITVPSAPLVDVNESITAG